MNYSRMLQSLKLSWCLIIIVMLSACADMTDLQRRTGYGAALGTVVGAGLGQLAGGNTKSTLIGAGAGAVLGGGSGYAYSKYLDAKEDKFRLALATNGHVQIIRESENSLKLIITDPSMFKVDSAVLSSASTQEFKRIASVFTSDGKFQGSCQIVGYTDSLGGEQWNQQLSERRAQSVQRLFMMQGVPQDYLQVFGAGATDPVATNETENGRRQNRRVELHLFR